MTNIESIVNALLENSVISEEEAIELVEMDELEDYKSFEDWKRNGYSVKKGEHRLASCMIWSRPTEEEDENGNKTNTFKRRYANIFSRNQVELTADKKAKRELAKAQPKVEKKAEKVQPKAEKQTKKAESPKVIKSGNVQPKAEKKVTKKATQKVAKAESKKAQPNAEKKLAKANTTKVVKAEKNQPKAEPKATKKLATKEVKRSFNISKRTEGKKQYIVITNYDKNGNVKATAELPADIYSSLDETRKANFRKIFNIA